MAPSRQVCTCIAFLTVVLLLHINYQALYARPPGRHGALRAKGRAALPSLRRRSTAQPQTASVAAVVDNAVPPAGTLAHRSHDPSKEPGAGPGNPSEKASPPVDAKQLPVPDVLAVPESLAHGQPPEKCRATADPQRLKFLRRIQGHGKCSAGHVLCAALTAASEAVHSQHTEPRVVLTTFGVGQEQLLSSFATAAAALRVPTVAVAVEPGAAKSIPTTPVVVVDGVLLGSSRLQRKWAAVEALLSAGVQLLYADVDAVLGWKPFELLSGDSDWEVLSEGWEPEMVRGQVMGSDDPSMGWSRYCETMRVAHVSTALFAAMPTAEAVAVAQRLAAQASSERDGWFAGAGASAWSSAGEAEAFSLELFAPSHDAVTRVGASVRLLPAGCWLNSRAALDSLPRSWSSQPYAALLVGRGDGSATAAEQALARHSAAVDYLHRGRYLGSRWVAQQLPAVWQLERTRIDPLMGTPVENATAKALVLRSHCRKQETHGARPLHWLVDPESRGWPTNCGEQPELCEVVRRVAVDRRVMAAVSNGNILQMLGEFVDIVNTIGIPNFMVVALDARTTSFLNKRNTPNYLRQLRSRSGSTDNHATSGLKFQILSELLSVGVSVMLSDVDIVFTQNPFLALYGDADVEGMSDGWDERSTFGHTHTLPVPGSSEGELRSFRMVARNSGLFYLSATHEALRLMHMLAKRMASEDVWDQSAYNQEIFRVMFAGGNSAGVSTRLMNYLCFMNTKTLFKYMRHDGQLIDRAQHKPVSIHVNYHPEKEARMVSIRKFYHKGDDTALDKWNGGEGHNSGSCVGKVGVQTSVMPKLTPDELSSHKLAKNIVAAGYDWVWSGQGPCRFDASGTFKSPWGKGEWGKVPSPWRLDSLHVLLRGETYLLMFLSEKWSFVAVRCSDEHVSYGRLQQTEPPSSRLVW